MALLFMDSFDHYATADFATKWTSTTGAQGAVTPSITAANGRRSSGGFRLAAASPLGAASANVQKTLAPVDATCVHGFAFMLSSATVVGTAGLPIAILRDSSTTQLTLRLNGALTLSVVRGSNSGTVLGTTTATLTQGVYAYIEWKVLIHPSAGTVDVRVNGVSVLSLTAQNTRSSANSSWNVLALGTPDAVGSTWGNVTGTLDYDDLYVCDGTGAAPWNNFLGDVRVDARYPTGAGATTSWAPSAAPNWGCVDETAPNGDTDYVSTSTVGATDTYATQDAAVAGATIYGVQHCLSLKKMDAGTCTVAPVIRHSGVDYPGADFSPGVGYAYSLQVAAVNPGTGVAWTEAGFNAAEFGYKKTA